MEIFILMSFCLVFGVLFIWYSYQKKSFKKTVETQGLDSAKKKFRIIKLCGYFLLFGAGIFVFFIIIDF